MLVLLYDQYCHESEFSALNAMVLSAPPTTLRRTMNRRIVVLDVETTGTDPAKDQIVELCVQFGLEAESSTGGGPNTQTWRIRPKVAISPGAQAVHGICEADLRECPPFAALADMVRNTLESSDVLVGYNVAFDIEMIQAEYDRLRQPRLKITDKKIVDAFRLWQHCEPRSLQDAHRRFVGEAFDAAHSAEADVAATGRVLRGMISAFGLEKQSWDGIAEVCQPDRARWIGPSRHVQWNDDEDAVLGFGKHSGVSIWELAHINGGGYIRWMVSKDFPAHVIDICKQALVLPLDQFRAWLHSDWLDRDADGPGRDQETATCLTGGQHGASQMYLSSQRHAP